MGTSLFDLGQWLEQLGSRPQQRHDRKELFRPREPRRKRSSTKSNLGRTELWSGLKHRHKPRFGRCSSQISQISRSLGKHCRTNPFESRNRNCQRRQGILVGDWELCSSLASASRNIAVKLNLSFKSFNQKLDRLSPPHRSRRPSTIFSHHHLADNKLNPVYIQPHMVYCQIPTQLPICIHSDRHIFANHGKLINPRRAPQATRFHLHQFRYWSDSARWW